MNLEPILPFVETPRDTPAAAMRARMAETGYLFFRGAVPADVVKNVRRQILDMCAAAGWLDASAERMLARANPAYPPTSEGKQDYFAVYRQVLKLPDFHNLPDHPALRTIAASLLDHAQPFTHPRRIGRVTFPNNETATTPAHQDHFYIRGAVETYSCWMPLGAVPARLGGLAVWPGSHKMGFKEHDQTTAGAVGGRGVDAYALAMPDTPDWHSTDFQPGDALFFHAYTVHKALPNRSGDTLRISTDNRYQRPQDAIEPGALKSHFGLVDA